MQAAPPQANLLLPPTSKLRVVQQRSYVNVLQQASQSNAQWSIVYDLSNLTIHMALGSDFNSIHTSDFSEAGVTLR